MDGTSAGSEYDQLMADTVTQAGDLTILLIDDGGGLFAPMASDSFLVLSATSLMGSFNNVANGARIDTIGGEGSFLVSYDSASDMVLVSDFLSAGLPGDFNGSSFVDGLDFLTWQTDGLSAAELTNWQTNYGQSGASTASTATAVVPEPSCLFLFAISFLSYGRDRGVFVIR
ncbi:hypothetical protein [Adhaeretor mobilis]|uniref:Uncharacterized protein n=1 Tax=Adhaeretor mobilis TaxID=1930276 RepID=A0A517N184_9BACT|nr:hypothetical protein [Adhaeretor mobilis]QDT00900.1 hypothetical protein HG15A2_42420 [Adhaeretor mobilis]